MRSRFVIPIAIASLAMGILFAILSVLDQRRVYHLTIATGSERGQYYAFGQALATVVERHQSQLRIEVESTEGSVQNMRLLRDADVQLALAQNDIPSPPSARAVASLFPEIFHVLVRPESGIDSMAELSGKQVALPPRGSGSYALFWQLAGHYGFSPSTLKHIALPTDAAHTAFANGDVDALSAVIALGNPSLTELIRTSQAILLPIEQVQALQLSQPFLEQLYVPQGAYNGNPPIPDTDLSTVGVNAVLLAHSGANPTAIRELTRILNEYRSELVALYPGAASIEIPTGQGNFGVPLHPGALSYYSQDRPNFLVTYAEAIGLLVSLAVLAASGGWQVRQRLLQRQKNRADAYNLKILDLIGQVYTANTLSELEQIRWQLFEILKKVVEDLDLDRITPESFESFTFPWEVAIAAIRHRELMIRTFETELRADWQE